MRSAVLAGLAVALLAPATALADEEIVAAAGNRYTATEVTIDQGEPLTFRNNDVSGPSHDVVSTANGDVQKRYLFASEIIGGGKTSFVEGSQYLTAGTYDFYCSLHEGSMKGRLVVTSAGTPKPRPGAAPPPSQPGEAPPAADQTPPEPSIDYGAMRAATIKKRRSLTLEVGADEAVAMRITVKVGKATVARKRLDLPVRGTKRVRLAVGRSARKAIRRGRTLRIVVDVVDRAGNPGTATDRVRLT